MRICLYTETALPKVGGQELVVDALARQFVGLGHDVVVLTQPPRRPLTYDDSSLPYAVVRHPRFISTRRLVGWYRYFIQKLYKRWPFDVLHAHSVYPCGYVAALTAQSLGVPLVLTSHGGDVRPGNIRISKAGLAERHELAIRHASGLVSISRFTSDGYRQLGADDSQIVEIPNGVDLLPFASTVQRPGNLDPSIQKGGYLLFLGRLHRRKGVDVLLEALARVPGSNDKLQVVVAGEGDERGALEAQCQELGLQQRVRFVGAVRGTLKTWLLQNALGVVMPSRTWESFGLVVLEAAAAGRPTIGTRLPGLADRIEHNVTGLLVAEESRDELATALSTMLCHTEFCDRLGSAARHVAERHDWSQIAADHVELYRRVANAARGNIKNQRSAA